MKLTVIKNSFYLVLMITMLALAFMTKDIVKSQLFASLGIITGALTLKNLSLNNLKK